MKKHYKALILDLDGTTIPNQIDGVPSKKVKDAIKKAKGKIHIGIATSRPFFSAKRFIKELQLSGASIFHSGAQIIDTTTGKLYSEHFIAKEDVRAIYKIAKRMRIKELLVDEADDAFLANDHNTKTEKLGVVAMRMRTEKEADAFCEALISLPGISAHKIVSWTNDHFDVSITNTQATKQFAILEVAEILGVKTHDIIGVGDGYNDFPLLMACGLKIAMGNAVPELKEIADYIAPSVQDDGVVDVIEKFVL